MEECIGKFTRAPVNYINKVRKLESGAITMKNTSFYPAFPLSLLMSLLSLAGLSIFMIYYFFTSDQNTCFANINYGIIALSIIYPIESFIMYVIMFGSVSLAQTKCWKVFSIIFFGIIVTGFSFGGIGFAFLCTISKQHSLIIPSDFLGSNTFIQVIVYGYLSFFALYIILLPLLTLFYTKKPEQESPEIQVQRSCWETFCCILYYIFQILFLIASVLMICIKLMGPPLLIYVLVEVARAGFQNQFSSLAGFFALAVLSIVLPFVTFITAYLIANYACKEGAEKQTESTVKKEIKMVELQKTDDSYDKNERNNTILLQPTYKSKLFGDEIQSPSLKNSIL